MKKLEEIELTLSNSEDGVFAISLVDKPAIKENFVFLSEQLVQLAITNEDKREVVGLVLVPEQRILRRVEDKEFNIFLKAETIKQASEKYMETLQLNNVTVDHQAKVNDVSVVESWIVEDAKMDKSNLFNLNAVDGSWAIKMKVKNDQVWQDVKSGKYKGFSIEALFSDMEKAMLAEEKTLEEEVLDELETIINQ